MTKINDDPEYEDKQKVLYAVLILTQTSDTSMGVDQRAVEKLCKENTVDELRKMVKLRK